MAASDDVFICHHGNDLDFVNFLTEHLENAGLKVWKSAGGSHSSKGKALVNSKVCIVVLSQHSVQDTGCEDAISLGYISDKPLFPVALQDFPQLAKDLTFSMKLILAKLNWMFFIPPEGGAVYPTDSLETLISSMRREIERVLEQQAGEDRDIREESVAKGFTRRRAFYKRWNSTHEVVEKKDFWKDKFGEATEVSWIDFRKAFLDVYKDQITDQMSEDRTKWILNILYGDVLELRKVVTRKMYDDFCGDVSWGPDQFFLRLMDYAKGTIAMRGVFNMKSTVRLDAVQNLGQFRTAPVISSLFSLLDDPDANMRAVAAIALGKTEVRSRHVVTKLISKLTDDDRLVREATCLSLGYLKAEASVPHLVKRWRSDVISDVRQAAEIALRQVGSDEAQHALHMTNLLFEEMSKLQGV